MDERDSVNLIAVFRALEYLSDRIVGQEPIVSFSIRGNYIVVTAAVIRDGKLYQIKEQVSVTELRAAVSPFVVSRARLDHVALKLNESTRQGIEKTGS